MPKQELNGFDRDLLEEEENDDEEELINDASIKDTTGRVGMNTQYGERLGPKRNQGPRDRRDKKKRPRPPYYQKGPVVVETWEEIQKLLQDSLDSKADRLNDFLNDPARVVQVFLSSYMFEQGFH